MANGVKIECVRVGELVDFVQRTIANARPGELIPLSPTRARAWSRNPAADPQDVALVAGFVAGRPAGALGLVPAEATLEGQRVKVHWASNFFVAEHARASGVGGMIVLRALSLGKDIFNTGFSDEAAEVYRAIGFRAFGPLRFLRADLAGLHPFDLPVRAARKLTRPLAPLHAVANVAGRAVSGAAKAWHYGRIAAPLEGTLKQVEARPVRRIEDVEFAALEDARHPTRFVHSADVVNWMLADRWVASGGSSPPPPSYFSDWRERFEHRALEIHARDDGRCLGFVVVRLEQREHVRTLIVFDHHFREPADARHLAAIALDEARRFGADRILLPAVCRETLAEWGIAGWFTTEERGYLAHLSRGSRWREALPQLHLEMTDGDVAFA